jgi:hypothetical protein
LILFALLAVAAGWGCGDAIEPMGPGSLQVEWAVAARGCDANDVDTIRLTVDRDGKTYEETTYPCGKRTTTLEDVPRDNYKLTAVGRGAAGETRFESATRRVVVEGDGVTEFVGLQLSALPATATVRWHFSNSQVCGSNGARRVEATLFGPRGYAVWGAERECSSGQMAVNSVPPGDYDLVIRALNAQGATEAQGALGVTLDPGGTHDVSVEMSPLESGE